MRIFALLAASAPVFVAAHGEEVAGYMRRQLRERQATSSTSSSSSSVSASAAPSAATPGPVSLVSTTTHPTVVLATTNPTAVPLSAIVSFQASAATIPLPATPTAGTHPSGIPNAPPLPDISKINPANYPALDVVPPTDSAQVQQWIAQVAATGIVIPNITATVAGGCPANPAAVADTSRCWWTCGGCTRAADITTCPATLNWGLTYDDGPAYYTPNLLTYLDSQSLKSTFFVVGSRVISFPHTLQYEYVNSHHIAVHTWSHPYLTQLTNEQIIAELGWSKKVIKDVLGVTPNMMRPPFGDIDDRVRAISLAMGLTPVMWTRISPQATFDTDDFDIHSGATSVYQVLQNWEYILGNVTQIQTGFIVLEHDLFEESVEVATGYILPDALAHNPPFTIKPVVGCQNLPLADAYIETNDNSTHPPALAAAVSVGAVTTTSVAPGSTSGGGSHSGATGISVPGFALALSVFSGIFAGVHML